MIRSSNNPRPASRSTQQAQQPPSPDAQDPNLFRCERELPSSSVNTTLSFTNYTGKPIYVREQSNLIFVVPPATSIPEERFKDCFVVEYTINFVTGQSVRETAAALIAASQGEYKLSARSNQLLLRLKEHLDHYGSEQSVRGIRLTQRRRIYAHQFVNAPYYSPDLDLLMGQTKEMLTTPHPNSPLGLGLRKQDFRQGGENFGLMVMVVDNDDIAPFRYYFAGREVVTVKSIRDKFLESGVYVTRYNFDRKANETTFEKPTYTFEEAKAAIGLYPTIEEAQTHGRPDLITEMRKTEETRAEAELKRLRQEAELLRIQHERDLLEAKSEIERQRMEHERERDRMKYEFENFKETLEARKKYREDYFDNRSYTRKDYYDDRGSYRKDDYDDRSFRRKDEYEERSQQRKDEFEEKSTNRKNWSESLKAALSNWGLWVALGGIIAGFFVSKKQTTS
jgi:hypothetical protein